MCANAALCRLEALRTIDERCLVVKYKRPGSAPEIFRLRESVRAVRIHVTWAILLLDLSHAVLIIILLIIATRIIVQLIVNLKHMVVITAGRDVLKLASEVPMGLR